MILLKKLHKWVALLIGIQVLLWLLSGLVMSLLDPAKVSGEQWARKAGDEPVTLSQSTLLEPQALPAEQLTGALNIILDTVKGQPAYRITRAHDVTLINAVSGQTMSFDRQYAEELAMEDFTGLAVIASTEPGTAPDMETRGHAGGYWRVNFSDPGHSSYYVSTWTGEILERRNSYWRVFDFFWMLHIMDYDGRNDFNNALIIIVALTAIWLGISGFLLLFYSFGRHEFDFLRVWRKRAEVLVTLIDPNADATQLLRLKKNSNLFLSLASRNINLPSICGGGGECGKCRVKIESDHLPAPTAAENGLVPKSLRRKGYRLACQYEVKRDVTVHLAKGGG